VTYISDRGRAVLDVGRRKRRVNHATTPLARYFSTAEAESGDRG
jgi:hypothetical protein